MSRTDDPIERFRHLFRKAREREPQDGTVMTLATATPDGRPSARTVLLKDVDSRGFAFYTNFGSRKAEELAANPRAALVFYWSSLDAQVRVEGDVSKIPDAEADAYFASRPRQSQLGAWASRQSEELPNRRTLIGRYLEQKARRLGRPVPRPDFWGGYRVAPARIEFWQSRLGRLHDRWLYTRGSGGDWSVRMLYP